MNQTVKAAPAVAGADRTFFAGANGCAGFASFYPDLIDERTLARLYIIKGGPGSGKSTLLRRLVSEAKDARLATEAYLCGSDPLSLDAAVIRGDGGAVAAIDATSPHAYDARYPGAAATVFDCGAFWDVSALRSRREAIIALADAKSAAYARAYRYLASLGGVRRDLRRFAEDALDRDKMVSACRRFARSVSRGGANDGVAPARRCAACFSMRGEYAIDAAPDCETVTVTDHAGAAPVFLAALRGELEAAGIAVTTLVDCVEPDVAAGLILPGAGLRVIPAAGESGGAAKNFNLTRFLRRDALAATKSRRTLARKCAAALADGARTALADAGGCHFALEDIYVAAMDFAALTAASDALIAEAIGTASAPR